MQYKQSDPVCDSYHSRWAVVIATEARQLRLETYQGVHTCGARASWAKDQQGTTPWFLVTGSMNPGSFQTKLNEMRQVALDRVLLTLHVSGHRITVRNKTIQQLLKQKHYRRDDGEKKDRGATRVTVTYCTVLARHDHVVHLGCGIGDLLSITCY